MTVDGTGHWTTSVTPAGQGALAVTAVATDAAGNSSSTTTNLTVDTIAPAVAITSAGGPVNQAAQTISGTGEAGTTITSVRQRQPAATARGDGRPERAVVSQRHARQWQQLADRERSPMPPATPAPAAR